MDDSLRCKLGRPTCVVVVSLVAAAVVSGELAVELGGVFELLGLGVATVVAGSAWMIPKASGASWVPVVVVVSGLKVRVVGTAI